jgi:TatA/E family protein of Tat protein translocase
MVDLNLPLALIPSFGWQEGLVILAVVLLVFGPSKLPEVAEAMGKSIRKFKNATRDVEDSIKDEVNRIDEGEKKE